MRQFCLSAYGPTNNFWKNPPWAMLKYQEMKASLVCPLEVASLSVRELLSNYEIHQTSRQAVKYRLRVSSAHLTTSVQHSRVAKDSSTTVKSDQGALVIPEHVHDLRCELV